MSADIILFRDPYAPLEGEQRAAALAALREYMEAHARAIVSQAFHQAVKAGREFGRLGAADFAAEFGTAIRNELARAGG